MSTCYAQVSSRTFKINVSQEGNTLDLQERKLINVLRGMHCGPILTQEGPSLCSLWSAQPWALGGPR